MKQRIDYIDRMKGLAIFLVVIRHIYGMVFIQYEDIVNRWNASFHIRSEHEASSVLVV